MYFFSSTNNTVRNSRFKKNNCCIDSNKVIILFIAHTLPNQIAKTYIETWKNSISNNG